MEQDLKQQIVKELGLSAMSPADQDNALERVGLLVFQSVIIRVMEELSEPDRDTLEKLISTENPSSEVVLKFLDEKIPNLEEVLREEVQRFKEESAAVMKAEG